ncbi:Flagellum-specific peptidoglycan hydrolase FlgJ [Mariniphaga anaerophila]|uniref:Flagellum-specific peptidoglycan hydrolase FlgJ n=1 Tax=Mariniphaga anaerophila TaxID=1484053 RepID=A0A1M5E498_9BACT|nr:glucosaminidase domain-containing protein [Mariniphaga anaerophila]SHF73974.1 Flagellum-specific peptidoglycan hydrolase FlgJ [Mariniphaga anaerophila]
MKQGFIIFLFITIVFTAQAQMSREQYILRYQLLAIEEMGRSGIPASIKMAQAVLESGNGNSELSRKSNNHFGIKCKRSWTGKRVYYDDDEKGECFRKYKSVEESYIDHTNFLMSNPRYAFLFTLPPTDYKGWAKGLKEAGYATARHYDKSLIKIIEDNQLYKLDLKQTIRPLTVNSRNTPVHKGISNKLVINPYGGRQIIKINDLKAVVAREGDTYEILAQSLGIETWELYKFNDHGAGYRPQPNEVVYIETKHRKASKDKLYHTASQGETMHFISQMYGLKLKPLYRRNRMKPGEQPQAGEVIYLHKKRPAR